MGKRIVILAIVIVLGAGFILWSRAGIQETTQTPATPTPISQTEVKSVKLNDATMEMNIPSGYTFTTENQMNLTTNEPYAVTFTVQNYTNTPNEVANPYQLYGIYQWDTEVTTPDAFATADYMLVEDTKESFTVDGKPAIKGVSSGERGRYTIYILVDGHLFTLAADGSDETHKTTTDAIVESMRFQ